MDRDTVHNDIKKCIDSGRNSRIFYRNDKLTELNALREKLGKQREQLEEELRELKSIHFRKRRTS